MSVHAARSVTPAEENEGANGEGLAVQSGRNTDASIIYGLTQCTLTHNQRSRRMIMHLCTSVFLKDTEERLWKLCILHTSITAACHIITASNRDSCHASNLKNARLHPPLQKNKLQEAAEK